MTIRIIYNKIISFFLKIKYSPLTMREYLQILFLFLDFDVSFEIKIFFTNWSTWKLLELALNRSELKESFNYIKSILMMMINLFYSCKSLFFSWYNWNFRTKQSSSMEISKVSTKSSRITWDLCIKTVFF